MRYEQEKQGGWGAGVYDQQGAKGCDLGDWEMFNKKTKTRNRAIN
jgi:hypothetical protein